MSFRPIARIGNVYFALKDFTNAIKFYEDSLIEANSSAVQDKLMAAKKAIKEQEKKAYLDPEKAIQAKEEGNEQFKKGEIMFFLFPINHEMTK